MIFDNALGMFLKGMDRESPDFVPIRTGGIVLNIGAGHKLLDNTVSLDLPEWNAEFDPIPLTDGSVEHIIAFHIIEHIQNVVGLLRECQRVLRVDGTLNIVVPYGASDIALQELDHKHFFTEETWKTLFHNPYFDKDKNDWHWRIGYNLIMGLNHRNLALVTQLIREP